MEHQSGDLLHTLAILLGTVAPFLLVMVVIGIAVWYWRKSKETTRQ